jgi:hypothetical protein
MARTQTQMPALKDCVVSVRVIGRLSFRVTMKGHGLWADTISGMEMYLEDQEVDDLIVRRRGRYGSPVR